MPSQLHVFLRLVTIVPLVMVATGLAQSLPATDLRNLVQSFKNDARGPYQSIHWFCPDGTVRPAQDRCPQPGGLQHAMLKASVTRLQQQYGLYLGQILAGTPFDEFLDVANQGLRMKQYQMEQFLRVTDNGWIFRRAQYYRGAVQVEEEEAWGRRFLTWLVARDDLVTSQFFLIRQLSQDIPHRAADHTVKRVRALAKTIADAFTPFTDLRVKLHGQPDAADLERVQAFRARHRQQLAPEVDTMVQDLEQALHMVYRTSDVDQLTDYVTQLPAQAAVTQALRQLIQTTNPSHAKARSHAIADLLWDLRTTMLADKSPQVRLAMIDLSLTLEGMLLTHSGRWQPQTVGGLVEKAMVFAKAAAGSGFLERWEWLEIAALLTPPAPEAVLPLAAVREHGEVVRHAVDWGAGMVRAVYEPVVKLFGSFEPLATGFIDDRIRASILLPFGEVAGQLSEFVASASGLSNRVLDLKNPSQMRGLNPGLALGELVVVTGQPEDVTFESNKIYVVTRAPADLKPVAGIATVTEGNTVSHVQLLARNLGIPNAVLTAQHLTELAPFSGERVWYAVSPRGTVLIKRAVEMTPEERGLVDKQQRSEDKIIVPTDKVDLSYLTLPSLYDVRATDSGRICGPKAANLGQLHVLFPGRVAPGLVLPFGVFRQHLDQPMPGTAGSYWDFLQDTFAQASRDRASGGDETAIEQTILQRLAQLRAAIAQIAWLPGFVRSLQQRFQEVFDKALGQVPVFVRSDTNMEDLKDFTGAGLNLTVPNAVSERDILQAIRDVWASPFTERSYRWRQKYLDNPEHVYPSIVLLRSVNVEKSGVMITTGLVSANPHEVTVAFNWGVGGAVEGQAAESYLLRQDHTDLLLSPTREPRATVLPTPGGVQKRFVTFDNPMVSRPEREQLRQLALEVRKRLATVSGLESAGPFDVELGFLEGAIWLFQVRPFVENRRARSSTYLRALDTETPGHVQVPMTTALGGR